MKAIAKLMAGATLCVFAAPAYAQDSGGQQIDDTADIIVTAQRSEQSLQKVPLSITAVTASTLASRQINSISQLPSVAPSLQIGQQGTFSIRGIGTLAPGNTLDSSVALAIDDVNLGQPSLAIDLFNDVKRVEVLNGPQGLLFGRNASAGLLNLVTAEPVLGKTTNESNFEVGVRDLPGVDDGAHYALVRDYLNLPLGKKTALRLDGFYSYEAPVVVLTKPTTARQDDDRERYSIRAKLLTEPTDALSIYIIGEYARLKGGAVDTTARVVGTGSLIGPILTGDGITPGPENFLNSSDAAQYRDLTNKGLQGRITYNLDNGWSLVNIGAWKQFSEQRSTDVDQVSVDLYNTLFAKTRYRQFSDEFRIVLPADKPLHGQLGLYYFRADSSKTDREVGGFGIPAVAQPGFPFCVGPTARPPCPVQNIAVLGRDFRYNLVNESYAAFGQLFYDFTSQFKVFAGGRVTNDKLHLVQSQGQFNYFRALAVRAAFDQSTNNTNFSYKVGVQYEPGRNILAYATYGSGYKGPGTNDNGVSPTANLIVKPETSNTGEVGLKTSFLDNRVTFNAALFYSKFKNYQTQSFNAAASSFIVQNAASVTSKGAEATLIVRPFKGLTLNGSAAFVDSHFNSFLGAQCYIGQPTPGCATTGAFDASDLRTPTTPKFTSSVQVAYETGISDSVSFFVSGNWYHRSTINYNINGAAGTEVPTIDVFDGNVGLDLANGMRLSLFCKNCTQETYPLFITGEPVDATRNVASFRQTFSTDSVRTIGLRADFRF